MTRELVINGRFLSRRVTGVERYAREITKIFGKDCRIETTKLNGVAGHAWEQFVLPAKLTRRSILWSPANTGPLLARNQALTIHDLSPLEHPEWFKKSFALWYRLFLPILARRVRVIFTPSEFVKRKVEETFGIKNIIVTPDGVDASIFCPDAILKAYDLPEKYILFVGSIQPRKNLTGLLKAWREIKDVFKDTWLIVAGEKGNVFRSENFSDEERVRFFGYVSDDELPGMYANAKLFVLPSFDEGFGLPALEALACGTPVIVSNGGALPEVVGDAGMIFDLAKPDDLSSSIKTILSDNHLRNTMKEKGLLRAKTFSWQTTAGLIWSKLNERM